MVKEKHLLSFFELFVGIGHEGLSLTKRFWGKDLQKLMLFEIANVINSRPIGTIPTSDPECPTALTPNDLLLGRSSNEVPQGPFETSPTIARRFKFVF